jgi:hypothetical protein
VTVQPTPLTPPALPGATAHKTDATGRTVPSWFLAAAVAFLLLIAGLAYTNSLHTDFALDNALVIGQDTRLRTWKWETPNPETNKMTPMLSLVFTEGYWYPNFPSNLYRPLTTITYAYNWSGPTPSTGAKVALYLVGAGIAFLLARQFNRRWWVALIVAVVAVILVPRLNWSLTQNGPDPTAAPGSEAAMRQLKTYGFHVTNLLIHIINVTLILVIIRRVTHRPWLALLTAAIFAVHPAETESVTNVVGRADQLATLWILAGFWCYLRAIATEEITDPLLRGMARMGWLTGLFFAALAGMFSKESGVMIGLLVPLYDFIFRWPKLVGTFSERISKAFIEFFCKGWAVMLPALLIFLTVRAGMNQETPTYGELFIDNPISRVPDELAFVTEERKLNVIEQIEAWSQKITSSGELTAFKVQGRYLGLLAFPHTLSCDYSFNQIPLYGEAGSTLWENAQCWISLVVVLGLLAAAWFRRLENPVFSFGVLFFFGMMLPTANFLFPIGSIMGERFLYLPSIGFCLVAALVLRVVGTKIADAMTIPSQWRHRAALGLPMVVLCALGMRTYARNADWATEFSLWNSAVSAAPNSFKVHKGLANGYWNRTAGFDDAIREAGLDDAIFRAEVGLAVLNEHSLPRNRQDNTLFCDLGMYYNLKARYLMSDKRRGGPVPTEAARFYQKGVDVMIRARVVDTWVNQASRGSKLQRGIKLAEISDVGNPRVHNQLAESYLGLGNWEEAAKSAAYSRHLGPNQYIPYLLLGTAQINSGKFSEGALTLVEGMLLDPANVGNNPGVWEGLRKCYAEMGQKDVIMERLLDQPNGQKGISYGLNPDSQFVKGQVALASAEIVRLLVEAKNFENAADFRHIAMVRYGVPDSALPAVPPGKPVLDFWGRVKKWLGLLPQDRL